MPLSLSAHARSFDICRRDYNLDAHFAWTVFALWTHHTSIMRITSTAHQRNLASCRRRTQPLVASGRQGCRSLSGLGSNQGDASKDGVALFCKRTTSAHAEGFVKAWRIGINTVYCLPLVALLGLSAPIVSASVAMPKPLTASTPQQLSYVAEDGAQSQLDALFTRLVPETCPPKEGGFNKYICYGTCCAVPWGPGGPICFVLSGICIRTGLALRITRLGEENSAWVVDRSSLGFGLALLASSVPTNYGGGILTAILALLSLL